MSTCQKESDVQKWYNHLGLRLKPLVRSQKKKGGWQPKPWVKGQKGQLLNG